jgi:hypothetical protein
MDAKHSTYHIINDCGIVFRADMCAAPCKRIVTLADSFASLRLEFSLSHPIY